MIHNKLIINCENSSKSNIEIEIDDQFIIIESATDDLCSLFYIKIQKEDWLGLKNFIDKEF